MRWPGLTMRPAGRGRRRMAVGALDETGQEKQGCCDGGREAAVHGLRGPGRERDQHGAPVLCAGEDRPRAGRGAAVDSRGGHRRPGKSLLPGLPLDLRFRTKGQLAVGILGDAYADGLTFGFVCGDEVYGSCTDLREYLEDRGQAYVLRVPSNSISRSPPGPR